MKKIIQNVLIIISLTTQLVSASSITTLLNVPEITCPADITLTASPSTCDASLDFTIETTSTCPGQVMTQIAGLPSGSNFPAGETINTFVLTADNGLSDTCSFRVSVFEMEAPEITCPPFVFQATNSLSCDAVVSYDLPSFTDNCPIYNETLQLHTGESVSTTFFCDDISASQHLRVFELGNLNPNIPFYISSVTIGVGFAQNNPLTTINIYTLEGILNYANMTLIGSNTVGIPNIFQGFFDFPVTALVPANSVIVVELVVPAGSHTVPGYNLEPQLAPSYLAATGCNEPQPSSLAALGFPEFSLMMRLNITNTLLCQTGGLPSGATFPEGTTTNTFVVKDLSGNSNTCSFDVIVEDNSPPLLDCPQNITLSSEPASCGAIFNYQITALENCGTATNMIVNGMPSGSVFPIGTTLNTITSTDIENNQSTCNFTVTVIDDVPPQITCSPDIIQDNDISSCSAIIDYTVEAFDNCEVMELAQITGLPSGSSFPVGPTVNQFMATDISGNTSICSFTVTILEREDPALTCPDDLTVFLNEDECETIVHFDLPEIDDNCVNFPATLRQHDNNIISVGYGCEPTGTSHHLRVFDLENMGLTGTFEVDRVEVGLGFVTGNPEAIMNIYQLNGALNYSNMTLISTGSATLPEIFNDYYEIPVAATLSVGNIYVFELVLPDGQMAGYSEGAQDAPSYYAAPDCGIEEPENLANLGFANLALLLEAKGELSPEFAIEVTAGIESGSVFPMGTTTNHLMIEDPSGNTATCSFNITVMDIPPVITCLEDVSINVADASCAVSIDIASPTAMDNCGGYSLSNDFNNTANASGTYPLGNTIVTWTATDDNGNTSTCSQMIIVGNDVLSANVTNTPTSCIGASDGSATISVSGGTPPVILEWYDGNTTPDISGLSAGIYGVTVTDGNNCSYVSQAIIEEPAAFVVTDTIITPSSSASPTGAIDIDISGGNPPYSYSWNNGATTPNPTNLSAGDYSFTVTDVNGCQEAFGPFTVELLSSTADKLNGVTKFELFPNPAQDFTKVNILLNQKEKVSLHVYNMTGQLVLVKELGTVAGFSDVLDLQQLPSGIYIIGVITSKEKTVRKLFVNK